MRFETTSEMLKCVKYQLLVYDDNVAKLVGISEHGVSGLHYTRWLSNFCYILVLASNFLYFIVVFWHYTTFVRSNDKPPPPPASPSIKLSMASNTVYSVWELKEREQVCDNDSRNTIQVFSPDIIIWH